VVGCGYTVLCDPTQTHELANIVAAENPFVNASTCLCASARMLVISFSISLHVRSNTKEESAKQTTSVHASQDLENTCHYDYERRDHNGIQLGLSFFMHAAGQSIDRSMDWCVWCMKKEKTRCFAFHCCPASRCPKYDFRIRPQTKSLNVDYLMFSFSAPAHRRFATLRMTTSMRANLQEPLDLFS
jgi:hypothetical protein